MNVQTRKVSAKEEIELRKLIVQGDESARQTLIEATMHKVAFFAWHYHTRSPLTIDELFAEGCVGLMEAARDYDYADAEYRFGTFAKYPITRHMHEATKKALKNSRYEFPHELDFFVRRNIEDESAQDAFLEIEERLSKPTPPNLHKHLPPEQLEVVMMRNGSYHGYQPTFQEIADALGISRSAASARHRRAMDKLREHLPT